MNLAKSCAVAAFLCLTPACGKTTLKNRTKHSSETLTDSADASVLDRSITAQSKENADCRDTKHGNQQARVRYATKKVSFGELCRAESQTRTCENGEFGQWTGSFQFEVCEVAEPVQCAETQHGSVETRIRYAENQPGPDCIAEIQERTCMNGEFGAWSGSFNSIRCSIRDNSLCMDADRPIDRVRFERPSVPYGSRCKSELQTRPCQGGKLGVWSGQFRYETCTIEEPKSCETIAHGQQETRTRFLAESVPFGQTCQSEVQSRTCANGELSSWSGTYAAADCRVEPKVTSARRFIVYETCAAPKRNIAGNITQLNLHAFDNAGRYDQSFGENGVVRIQWPDDEYPNILDKGLQATRVTQGSDGKIIVIGQRSDFRSKKEHFLLKLLPNGRPDPSFSRNGLAILPLQLSSFYPESGTYYGDLVSLEGSVFGLGSRRKTADVLPVYEPMIIRTDEFGKLVDGFGVHGIKSLDRTIPMVNIWQPEYENAINMRETSGMRIDALPDGKLLATYRNLGSGSGINGNRGVGIAPIFVKFDRRGNLDTSFGPKANGMSAHYILGPVFSDLTTIQNDGKIISYQRAIKGYTLWVFSNTGILLGSLKVPYHHIAAYNTGGDIVESAVGSDGNLFFLGSRYTGNYRDIGRTAEIFKLKQFGDGSLENEYEPLKNFGGAYCFQKSKGLESCHPHTYKDGYLHVNGFMRGLNLDSEDNIFFTTGSNTGRALVGFRPDGTINTNFGLSGAAVLKDPESEKPFCWVNGLIIEE